MSVPVFGVVSAVSSAVKVSSPAAPASVRCASMSVSRPFWFTVRSVGQLPACVPTATTSSPRPVSIDVGPEIVRTATTSFPALVVIDVEPVCVDATVTRSGPEPSERLTSSRPE